MRTAIVLTLLLCSFFTIELCAQVHTIELETIRNKDKSVSFSYKKYAHGTYYLNMWFTRLENANARTYKRNITGMVGNIITIEPSNNDLHINLSYRYWYIRGKLKPKIDLDFVYLLPLSSQKAFKVSHLSNLNAKYFGAKKPKNWNAYCFYEDIGDTVYAARKGIIVQIKNEHDYLTEYSVSYQSTVNKILVEHPDGTLASYEGFHKDHIFLQEGDKVYPRTPLGTLAQYDDRAKAQLRFSIYYLDFVSPGMEQPTTYRDKIQHYAYLVPKFLTNKGLEYLQRDETYKAVDDKEIKEKELTRKELKKRAKTH